MKVVQKVLGMLASAALLCAGNLCINASKQDGQIPYISVTVTFLIEVLKLLMCVVAIVVLKEPVPANLSLKESVFYAVPSLLYMIDNNLTYIILRYIDPATLSVLWNLKIITTAVLFRFVLKRRLSEIRKIAIVLLLLGVVTSQSDHIQKEKTHMPTPSTPASAGATSSSPQDFLFAMILLLTAVTISSCASVFTEWAFKRKSSCSFLWQNAQLYVYGIFFNGIGVLIKGGEISSRGFFDGYNGWTFAVVFVNCVGGISMGFILKYLDNIACVYAHAVAMMMTMFFSMLFFKFTPSLEFICGLSVLLISMYLYHHKLDSGHASSSSSPSSSPSSPVSSCHAAAHEKKEADGSAAISSSVTIALSAAGLHSKKKHYEKLPDVEMGEFSPVSTGSSSTSRASSD